MPAEQKDDDLLMSLVDSALARPPQERERYLRSVCPDDTLFEEVRVRVEWEERMGTFLREPLINREAPDHPFQPGTRLGDRFRIIREVGSGGMGVVYEAIDEKLDRRIAIKCAKLGFQSRLPPEARTAREVSHFNVCKVHDLHVASTPFGGVDFLSMEFIEGETLSERIRRAGALPEPEAREIAGQLCAGLAQAHRQGVVHGDLKCGNIILTRSPEGGLRAVITDFGLAKLKLTEGGSNMMSERGGTLDYMAPELLLGARVSVASDLYALGVIFHMMLTGRTPARTTVSPIGEHPKAPSPPPQDATKSDSRASTVTMGHGLNISDAHWRRRIADLPAPWKKIVSKCLAPRPQKRFSSAEQVRHRLEAKRSVLPWTLAAAVFVAVVMAIWQWPQKPAGPPVRLAVLPFFIDGEAIPSAAGIGLDIADRLSGLRKNFNVISPREAQRNQVNTVEKAKSVLGATHTLETRLRNSGSQIVALASIVDTGSGQTLRALEGTYAPNDTRVLAKALIATVTGAFDLRVGVPQEAVSGPAYSSYVQGVALMRRDIQSADEAIPFFNQAIEFDPRSALPYAGLADAQLQNFLRGHGRQWLDLAGATIAKAKSINADSVPVLLASGAIQQEHGWYEQAIREFTRASELEPNNSEAWHLLAVAYEKTNRSEDAVATYRKAIQVQPNYYRHYIDFGNFYLNRSQFRDAEDLYRRAIVAAPENPSSHMNLGLALMEEGRFADAEQSLLTALRLRKTAQLLMNLGALYYEEERYQDAVRFFEESLAAGPPSAIRYADLGDGYRHLGRFREATDAYRTARSLVEEEVTRNPRQAISRVRLALFSAQLGDSGRASVELAQALAMEPENTMVMREAVRAYEVLRQREQSLGVLHNAPAYLLQELNRQPDVKDLRQDPRFQELMQKKSPQ